MTDSQNDPIIAKMLQDRNKMTDVDETAELERQKRMFVMLRWSEKYKKIQVHEANSKWQQCDADDPVENDTTINGFNLPVNQAHILERASSAAAEETLFATGTHNVDSFGCPVTIVKPGLRKILANTPSVAKRVQFSERIENIPRIADEFDYDHDVEINSICPSQVPQFVLIMAVLALVDLLPQILNKDDPTLLG
ncbi:UNVERIFIED_CONTAM: hypothetical protein HDU68_004620 [Siphonaria sp. JEL0065]|nr:hypothetical protein HDU68_004620 [Siphonaria sp. JEL0065]